MRGRFAEIVKTAVPSGTLVENTFRKQPLTRSFLWRLIPGSRKVDRLKENLDSTNIALTPEKTVDFDTKIIQHGFPAL